MKRYGASEKGTKDRRWKNKIEEIFPLMKEMAWRSIEQKMKGSTQTTEHEVSHSQRSKKKTVKMTAIVTEGRGKPKSVGGREVEAER